MADRRGAWALVAAFVLAALVGPLLFAEAGAPALAATAAQLLAPGSLVQEVRLDSGGFVRGLEVVADPDGLRVRGAQGWRVLPATPRASDVSTRRMWLGTDQHGRDLLALTLHGARTSLLVGTLATVIAVVLGTGAGLAATFAPTGVDAGLRLATDGLLALPRLLLLLVLGVALRPLPYGVALALGLASWMELARLVEGEGRALRRTAFAEAARSTGVGRLRLAARHVLPNVSGIIAVGAALIATEAILLESTLGYLGVGASGVSWGRIVADGQRLLPRGWWIAVFPGLLLTLSAIALHRLGASGWRER